MIITSIGIGLGLIMLQKQLKLHTHAGANFLYFAPQMKGDQLRTMSFLINFRVCDIL